jgi:hypothetical protein
VTLDANLGCDGTECLLDTVHSVKVESADGEAVYFAYKWAECVNVPFFANAQLIKARAPPTPHARGVAWT